MPKALLRRKIALAIGLLASTLPGFAHADRDDYRWREPYREHHHRHHYYGYGAPIIVEQAPIVVERPRVYRRYEERYIIERPYYPAYPVYRSDPSVVIGVNIPPLVIPLR